MYLIYSIFYSFIKDKYMKKISFTFILCFICSIFCLADTWKDIHGQGTEKEQWKEIKVQGTEKPLERGEYFLVTYNGQHYLACGKSLLGTSSDIWLMDLTNSTQTFRKIYTSNDNEEFRGQVNPAPFVLNDKLYVLYSGYNNIFIYSYDFTATRKGWIKENSPTSSNDFTPRFGFAVATIDNNIYVFGGYKFVSPIGFVEDASIFGYFSYSSKTQEWTFQTIPLDSDPKKIPEPSHSHTMIAINNALYLFGGYGKSRMLNDLWKYDVSKNAWQKIDTGQPESEIPKARMWHTMHANKNKEIWILGGLNDSNEMLWEYDIAGNKWIRKESAPISFSCHRSVLQEGKEMKIYIWSGRTTTERGYLTEDTIYEYTYIAAEEEKEIEKKEIENKEIEKKEIEKKEIEKKEIEKKEIAKKIKIKDSFSFELLGIVFVVIIALLSFIILRNKK